MNYFDFNDTPLPSVFELIPQGTLVKVRLTLCPGGYDDPDQGWTGGYATCHPRTGSVYLNVEFTVLAGEYARCKLRSRIGLFSPKGPTWGQMGRAFIRAMLCSARGIHPKETSPEAKQALCIQGFAALDGLVFLAPVDWENDPLGQPRHVIKRAILPEHPAYAQHMGAESPAIQTDCPSWAV